MNDLLQVSLGIIIAAIFAAGLIAWAEQIETWWVAASARWRRWKDKPKP